MTQRTFRALSQGILFVALLMVLAISSTSLAQTVITMASTVGPTEPSYIQFRNLLDRFEQNNPDIKVDLEYIEAYGEQVIVRILAGQSPDIFWVGNNAPDLAASGFLLNLTPYIQRDNVDLGEFIPSMIEAYTYQGDVYGYPNDSAPHIFYYNRQLLEQAGFSPTNLDLTWDSFVDMTKRLTRKDGSGEVTQWGFGPLMGNEWVMSWVWQNGGSILTPDNSAPAVLTPEFIGGVQFLYDLMYEHEVAPPAHLAHSPVAWGRFLDEDAAILQQGAWLSSTMLRDVDFEWGMLMPPKGKVHATGISYGGFSIPYNSNYPDEAWRLLKYLGSEDGQTYLVQQGYAALPANRAAAQNWDNVELAFGDPRNPALELNVVIDAALVSQTMPIVPQAGEISGALSRVLDQVWFQETPAESAAIILDEQIRSILQ